MVQDGPNGSQTFFNITNYFADYPDSIQFELLCADFTRIQHDWPASIETENQEQRDLLRLDQFAIFCRSVMQIGSV